MDACLHMQSCSNLTAGPHNVLEPSTCACTEYKLEDRPTAIEYSLMLSVLHLTSSNSKHTTVEVYSDNSDISCTEGAYATTTDSTKASISQLTNIVVVIIISIYKLLY